MDKEDGVYIYIHTHTHTHTHTIYTHTYIHTMKYFSDIKKNEILPFVATWMDLENIILGEVCQTEKDKYPMVPLICGIYKIIQMNLYTIQKQTHRHRK